MSRPRFPVANLADIITRPGATNHAGAKDQPRRMADLERFVAAASGLYVPAPPSGTPNGRVATSDTSQTGGVKWQVENGLQLGYNSSTSDLGSTGDKLTLTITGDGVNPVHLYATGFVASTSAGAVIDLRLRDGALNTGTIFDAATCIPAAAGSGMDFHCHGVVPAFSGSKTIYLNMQCSLGTPTMYGSRRKIRIRATWAPGYTA